MTPERWQHIKEIFSGALERPPDDRESFILSVCGEDEETCREVFQLISAHDATGEFLAVPAFDIAARSLASSNRENLTQGESIRHYTVISAIGTGGMGEVYLATDTRLGRNVAIKLVSASVTTQTDRFRRFEREARAASALNHPNLCTIHEVGEMDDGRPYIVMEYIEGMTLRQRLNQGRLLLLEALDIAMQIGSALTAAHQAGIVHRDVKPENITLRPDGIVKVLDFGLAKLTEQRRDADSTMPTQLRAQTQTGMIMGTARYMSPEQARGYPVDVRTDIWSLGVVIYEMTAGRVPFDGATNTDVVVSVLEREPAPLMDHLPQIPAELDRIVTKALRKNREERYRTIKDLCRDLKNLARELELKGTTPSVTEFEAAQAIKRDRITNGEAGLRGVLHTSPANPNLTSHLKGATKPYRRLVTLAVVSIALMTVVTLTFLLPSTLRKILQRSPTTSMSESPVRVVPFTSFLGREDHADFSPDGNQVAFVWGGEKDDNPDIYVKSISGERPLRITSHPAIDVLSAWSPDGQTIAFIRIEQGRFTVYTVPSLGNGAERKLLTLSAPTQKISWSPDGRFIAVTDKESGQESAAVFLFSLDTGEKHRLTSPPANIYGDFCPTFSPDGQSVAFIRAINQATADVYVMRAVGGEGKQLTTDSRLRFYDQGVVGGLAWTADGQAIVYSSEAGGSPSLWKVSISGGTPERLSVGGVDTFYPSIARKGNRLAFTQIHGGTPVYQIEVPTSKNPPNAPVRLIASTRSNHTPQFSPDGEKIAFESDRSGTHEIWIVDRDGTNPTQLTRFGGPSVGWPRWSPDRKQIVVEVKTSNNIGHIYTVNVEGGSPRRVTSEIVDEGLPTWSRDGKWIYFCSNRTGNQQLWKVRIEGGQAVQVTKDGGFTSFESADGKFLYYSKGPPGVWRVPVDGGEETLVLDIPQAGGWGAWTVVDDGIYFINTAVEGAYAIDFFSFTTRRVKRITVMQNVNEFVAGLTISPDRRRILYTQQDKLASDIMLVENFR